MRNNQLISQLIPLRDGEGDNTKSLMIKRIKKKDISVFMDWIDSRKEKYYKIGWSYLYNQYDIEDVFQITIVKVYQNINQLKKEQFFETWVTSIFINECKGILRKKKRETTLEYIEDVVDNRVLPTVEENYSLEFREQLDSLEDIHKEVIILKYICGYSQEEIAQILEVPLGTVKSRLYRALRSLRDQLDMEVL